MSVVVDYTMDKSIEKYGAKCAGHACAAGTPVNRGQRVSIGNRRGQSTASEGGNSADSFDQVVRTRSDGGRTKQQ